MAIHLGLFDRENEGATIFRKIWNYSSNNTASPHTRRFKFWKIFWWLSYL